MPAITLGFAEVEERLGRVRRRLNAGGLVHAGGVAASAVVLIATALVLLEFRLSPEVYGVAAWSGVLLAVAAVVYAAVGTRRRWLDSTSAAFVADRHGGLADRLTTLVGVRTGQATSRLLPALLAQLLALGDRWQPEQVAPWRVPRSLWWLAAALVALLATPLFVAQPPPIAVAASGVPAGALRPTGMAPQPAGPQDAVTVTEGDGTDSDSDSASGAPDTEPHSVIAANAAEITHSGDAHRADGTGATDRSLLQFAERLRRSLARPFQQNPGPPQTASGPAPLAGVGRIAAPANARGGGEDDDAQAGPGEARAGTSTSREESKGPGSSTGRQPPPGHAEADTQSRHDRSGRQQASDAPPAPGAGSGSSPESLLAARGSLPPAAAPRAFKLTLTSFLQAAEREEQVPSPRQRRESTGGGPGAGGEHGTAGLNDRQLANDPIRKAAIPGEYEDLIRRVFTRRLEP